MKPHPSFLLLLTAGAVLLFAGMVLMQVLGRRLGRARLATEPSGAGSAGFSAVDGAIFALLGLLLAFTFDGAANRFDHRRALAVQEINAIDTAYLRLDLLPERPRAALQGKVRLYVSQRLETYRALPDFDAARVWLDRSRVVQEEIWSEALTASRAAGPMVPLLLLPAVNEMLDIMTTRLLVLQEHPPLVVFVMLGGLALLSGVLAGYGMAPVARRPTLHVLIYAATLAIAVYVILDLEYPRLGFIRVDHVEKNLEMLLGQLK